MVSVWETQAWGLKKEEAADPGHGKILYADLPGWYRNQGEYWLY